MGANIVVIDAEPVVRKVITLILESNGHAVQAASDFHSGLEMVRSTRPELVITNVFLPEISGRDAMLRIREEFPELRVLMVSGLPNDPAILEWTQQRGFDTFPKPFRSDEL